MSSLDALAQLLKGAPFDLTAEEIADAIWLATVTGPLEAGEVSSPSAEADAARPDEQSMPDARPEEPTAGQPGAPPPTRTLEKGADVILPRERVADASRPFRSPTAAAIPDPLALGRALRPLRRPVPSAARSVLDEGATATFVADTFGLWLPVMKPAMSRWLDLALVVEDSPSMRLWSRTTAELEPLLQFNGAFRSVTAWRLGTDGALGLFSGRDRSGAAPRAHRELLDAQGRRAILIVSDCISSAWSDGTFGEWLASWTSCGPVAVLQVLPPHLWGRTALRRGLRATFSAATPALPNRRLSTHYITPPPKDEQDLLALPIATLEPDSLGAWARLVAGLSGESHGVALPSVGPQAGGGGEEVRPTAAAALPTAEARVRRFRATSSEAARRLASCLAVVPIMLPIVRLIRASLVPEARDGDIAEVFLGGLLREVSFDEDPDRTEYDFHDGVRALLLDYLPGRDALQVIARVSRYIEPRLGETQDFLAGLTAVIGEDGSSFAQRQRRFATLAVRALERLGDDYRENVAALYGDIASPGSAPGPKTSGTGTRFLEDMAAEYERTRERLRAGQDRTSTLDALIEDVILHARSNAVGTDLIRALYATARDGARVIALGCCVGAPEVALVETVTDALRSPRTRFELWWALRAAQALIESISPLLSEPCAAAVLEQLDGATSLLNVNPDGASLGLAHSVVNVFARRIGLPDSYSVRPVRHWVEAGARQQEPGRSVAIVGRDSPGESRDFCRALGARLAAHGWKVVAGRGANPGTEVITGFLAAGGHHDDALFYSSDVFESIERMRRNIFIRADGAFLIAGAVSTAAERDLARAEGIPTVVIGFTGGVAAQTASEVRRDLAAQGISADLYRILEARRDVELSAEAAVRLLDLAVRQRVSEGTRPLELYDDAGLRRWLVAAGRCREDEILEMVNIFATRRQRTWLVCLPGRVLCILDAADTRRKGRLVQFVEPPERLLPVNTRSKSSNTGFLNMGRRREWLYSFKLYPEPAGLVSRVKQLVERSRLAGIGEDRLPIRPGNPADSLPFPLIPVCVEGPAGTSLEELLRGVRSVELVPERSQARFAIVADGSSLLMYEGNEFCATPLPDHGAGRKLLTERLERWARAEAVRNLVTQDLPHDAIEVAWGRVEDGRQIPHGHDARVHVGEQIYVAVRNRAPRPLYIAIFDIGIGGKISLLTTSTPQGTRLEPGQFTVLGQHDDEASVRGIGTMWPEDVPQLQERCESLVVIAATSQTAFTLLEARPQPARGVSTTRLEIILDSYREAGTRDLGVERPNDEGFCVHRIDFNLSFLSRAAPQIDEASARTTPHGARFLFVAANPWEIPPRALGEEFQAIRQALGVVPDRDGFALQTVMAGRARDLVASLQKVKPTILHLNGRVSAEGLRLDDSRTESDWISPGTLGSIIKSVGTVRLIVLSSSYSDLLAAALLDAVDCTIGMKGQITDRAALAFLAGFYGALGHGHSVGDAFRHGAASLGAVEPNAEAQPQSLMREGIDIDTLVLSIVPGIAAPLARTADDDVHPAAARSDPRPVPAFDPHAIRLGVADGTRADPIVIPLEDIKTHIAFLGSTGSGKTTAALSVIEQLLERGISVLLVDRKGDLSRYASEAWWTDPRSPPSDRERKAALRAKIEIGLYTPGNPQGRPLRLPPIPALDEATPHDREQLARLAASALGAMMGYGNSATHKAREAILQCAIMLHALERDISLDVLLDTISRPDPELLHTVGVLQRHLAALTEDLQTLSIQYGSLFSGHGDQLDVAKLLSSPGTGRARLSIINTFALTEVRVLQFWISRLLVEVGRFGRKRPSPTLQAAAFFDEADAYVPATTSPPTKEPMFDLLRRSRAAGIGILLATQNPGDFDYRARDNIYTWLLGKITQSRAIKKMRNLIANYPDVGPRLASQRTGNFFVLSGPTKRELKADRPLMEAVQLSEAEVAEVARATQPQRHPPRE